MEDSRLSPVAVRCYGGFFSKTGTMPSIVLIHYFCSDAMEGNRDPLSRLFRASWGREVKADASITCRVNRANRGAEPATDNRSVFVLGEKSLTGCKPIRLYGNACKRFAPCALSLNLSEPVTSNAVTTATLVDNLTFAPLIDALEVKYVKSRLSDDKRYKCLYS